ncbi:MAG: hypothetical protein ABIS35_03970 [Terracoccus sp.]
MTDRIPAAAPGASVTMRGLARARTGTGEMGHELLTHLPELGDPDTQRELDGWVEQAADTLQAVSSAIEQRLLELGRGAVAAEGAGGGLTGPTRPASAEERRP